VTVGVLMVLLVLGACVFVAGAVYSYHCGRRDCERAWGIAEALANLSRLDPATCRAQGHGRVACERCGAELVGLESVRQGQAVGRG
jgi:hypothetical protein